MTTAIPIRMDPDTDLLLEREVDVAPELVWAAWTEPQHLVKWFTPAPYTTVDCEIDLRPGGIFRTVMRSPEGEESEGAGCYLEVIEHERLVWTSTLGPGFRPNDVGDEFAFTAVISMERTATGTKYSALAMHATETDSKRHADMGFHDGWGAALDQLVALAKTM